jgi:hypothetical protein
MIYVGSAIDNATPAHFNRLHVPLDPHGSWWGMGQQQRVSTEFKQPTGGAAATEGVSECRLAIYSISVQLTTKFTNTNVPHS